MVWKWFVGIKTLKDLRAKYISLAKTYHPDVGGNETDMKEINAERDKLKELLENGCDINFNQTYYTQQTQQQSRRKSYQPRYQSQTRRRKSYAPPKNEKPFTLEELLRERERRGYKKGWVAMKALEYATSYEDCLEIARALYYKEGWAWYRWQEIQSNMRNKRR